jgi:DNA-binding IclR family transcriptional regulator
MHQQKSKNTKKNHWDRLDALIGNEPEPTGEEWFTTKELRERMGISEATAHRRLAEMNRKGNVRSLEGRVFHIKPLHR